MDRRIWEKPTEEKSLDEAETPLWFWNADLDDRELVRQMELMSGIGVKAVNPHARTENGAGYRGGYLDKDWFGHLRTVLSYKKQHGEKMWLYDEIDWPAGTCGRTVTKDERYREKYISMEVTPVPAGKPFRTQLLTFEGQGLFGLDQHSDYSGVAFNTTIIDQESGQPYDLMKYLSYGMFGPELEFISDREAVCIRTKICVDPYENGGDESVSYISREATEAFIRSTYEKYDKEMGEDFGTTITSTFNDETRMCHAVVWSDEFAEVFRQRNGYDIRKNIWRLIFPGTENGRVRVDYADTVAWLYQTRYFKVLYDWCHAHRLKFFAHLLAEETLFGHVRYSGDYLRQGKYQDIVGADYLGKGIGSLNLKFTACSAHSYGKKRTAVEIFAGCGWDLTFREYTRMITFAYQQGMQCIINHGFFYSAEGERANDWPPSEFFQWKYWNRQAEGNAMIRRLTYAMTDGVNEADVLVYMPAESFCLHYLPDLSFTHAFEKGALLKDEKAIEIDRDLQRILNRMLSGSVDFDMVHRDAVVNFAVEDGKIVNKLSGQHFSVLLLPMCEVLPESMASLALAFARQGGHVIVVGDMPSYGVHAEEDGKVQADMKEAAGTEHFRVIRESTEDADEKPVEDRVFEAVSEIVPHPVRITSGTDRTYNRHPNYPPYLIDPYMHTGETMTGVQFVRYSKDGHTNVLFMNYSDQEESIEVYTETPGGVPEVWDTLTGEIRPAEVVRREADGWTVRLSLPDDHGVFLVVDR